MTKLYKLAKLIRSKNAKPFILTIDIQFSNIEEYKRVKESGVINKQLISKLYNTPIENILFFEYDECYAIKISIPRPIIQGDLGDADYMGCQQISELPEVEIP